MAELKDVEIQLNKDLVKIINWLKEYKQYADEALGVLVELDVPENLKGAQKDALKALNIGAKNEYKRGMTLREIMEDEENM